MPIEVTVCGDCGVAYDADADECPVCENRIASEVHVVSDDSADGSGSLSGLLGAGEHNLSKREVDLLLGLAVLVIAAWAVLNVMGVL